MNMKKILASAAAATLAVTAFSMSASAVGEGAQTISITADKLNEDILEETFYTQVQMGHINKIDSLTIKFSGEGKEGYMMIATSWGGDPAVEANNFKWECDAWSGGNVTFPEGTFAEDEEVDWSKYTITCTVDVEWDTADYWVNTLGYDLEPNYYEDCCYMRLGGGNCSDQQEFKTPAKMGDSGATDTGADTGTDTTGTDTDAADGGDTKPATDTGVGGIAAVVGVAVIAAGAVVVSKKRK